MTRPSGTASAYARRDPYDPEGLTPVTVNVCPGRFRVDEDIEHDLPDVATYEPLAPYADAPMRFSRYDGFNPDLHSAAWARPARKEAGGTPSHSRAVSGARKRDTDTTSTTGGRV